MPIDSKDIAINGTPPLNVKEDESELPGVDHVVANALLELYHEQPVTLNLPPGTVAALRSLVSMRQDVPDGGPPSEKSGVSSGVVHDADHGPNAAVTSSKSQGRDLEAYQAQMIDYLTKHGRQRRDDAVRFARIACKRIELNNYMNNNVLQAMPSLRNTPDIAKEPENIDATKRVRGPYKCYVCGKSTNSNDKKSSSSSLSSDACFCLPEMLRVPPSAWIGKQQQHPSLLVDYLDTITDDIITLRAEYARTKRFAEVKNKKKQLRKGAYCEKTDNRSKKYKCHRCLLPIGCSQHNLNSCQCLGLCRCRTITVRVPIEIWADADLTKSAMKEKLLVLFSEKLSDDLKCGGKGKKRHMMFLAKENSLSAPKTIDFITDPNSAEAVLINS